MICIFSTSRDQSTTEVMRWLQHLGCTDVLRINSDKASVSHSIVDLDVDQDTFSFRLGERTVNLSEIKAVWYRKGKNWLSNQFLDVGFNDKPRLSSYLRDRLSREETRLAEYLHFLIENAVPALGSSARCDLNKLLVLHAAKKVGLLTPPFRISNSRDVLAKTVKDRPHITKPITDVVYLFDIEDTKTGYFSYTEAIVPSTLDDLPCRISPSLVQEQIIKKYEVRVFYLEGSLYPMAIFSQRDEQTQVDFRRYNYLKPNRAVPLELTPSIRCKITSLFTSLGLNTGSADFIVDRNGQYYFLEINPVGQFSMVSTPCNLFLEREVAVMLCGYNDRNKHMPEVNRRRDNDGSL